MRIYGRISDTQGFPLELVSIAVKNSLRGTTSDSNGNYELENGLQDSLTLVFSRIGYLEVEHTLPCTADYGFSLSMSSTSQQIEGVTVEEDRIESVRMNKIDAKSSQIVPDASGSGVEALITTLPGVSTTNEMSSQYSVRGGNFDENLVYVNGVEVYRPLLIRSGQQEGLSFINPALVSNISFSSGGFDAQYGDKMSSVLAIQYRKPTGFAASASVGLLGASAHLETLSKDGKFSQLHGVRYKTSTYLLNTLDTDGEYDPSFVDYQTLLNYKFNSNLSLSFLGNYSYNQYNFVPQSRETKFGTYTDQRMLKIYFEGWENDIFSSFTGAATLDYTPNSTSSYKLSLSSFATNERERYDILGEYWLNEVDSDTGSDTYGDSIQNIGVGGYMEHARNDLRVNINSASISGSHVLDNHYLSWGTTVQTEQIKDNLTEWVFRDSSGFSQPQSKDTLKMYSYYRTDNNFNSVRLKGYVQDSYKADKISLNYGVRYSYWSFSNELVVSPRAAIVYAPDDTHFLRFATGRYVQTPFYKEIRNRDGELNKDIESQKSLHFVLGYDYFFKMWERPFKYTFEAYYKHMTDLIPYDVDNVRLEYYGDNMSKGYAYGFESRIYGEFVPGVDSWMGLTLMKTAEKIDGMDDYVPRPTDQRYNFTMFFQDYLPGNPNYKTHLRMVFGGGLPFGPPNGDKRQMTFRSRPYQRVDWGLSRLVTSNKMAEGALKSLWIDLEVLNLFGIQNTNSYFWVSDVNGTQYAVPNYLTGRRLNIKVTARF
ncbi:MAG: carboxypeptidase-like regulatory domain-containing protein [Bacteroidales bacterium]|nr:carboxypeptidase-like regulatory domain-containing protein [Bacteroidales bacterium]